MKHENINKVSVIVPVYNMSAYVDRCIESVINQTYPDFSLILLDDGSTDDSLEKCIAWGKKDHRIVVVSKRNQGQGATRNLGMRITASEYVTFLDADDWWHPRYLELMLKGTEQGRNDIVLCDMNFVQQDSFGKSVIDVSRIRFESGRIDLESEWNYLCRARTFMCGKLYRRSLFEKYKVEQPSYAYEDVAIVPYIVSKAASIFYVPQALYYYLRNRPDSTINDFSSMHGLLQALADLYQRFKADGSLPKYYDCLRQLFWGQLVFVHRNLNTKFMGVNAEECKKIETDAMKIVYKCFPELKNMASYTFGVPTGNELIIQALKHLVLDERNILQTNKMEADFIIVDNEKEPCPNSHILVNLNIEDANDVEWVTWDLADDIFYQLWNK